MTGNRDEKKKPSWMRGSEQSKEVEEKPARARYELVYAAVEKRWRQRPGQRARMMQDIADRLWEAFGGNPYSWCGFYLFSKDAKTLELGAQQGSPAAKALDLKSFAAKAALEKVSEIAENAPMLGVSLDGGDESAVSGIAVPVFAIEKPKEGKGGAVETVLGVFEATSSQPSAFGETDRRWLEHLLRALRACNEIL